MKFIVVFVYFFSFQLNLNFINGSKLPSDTQEPINIGESQQLTLKIGDNSTENSLVCAQAIWRHGSRAQIYSFPTDEYDPRTSKVYGDEVGFGQLTRDGVKSSYRLGKYLRSRYNNFLAYNFSLSELYVSSSETHRTVMTALSVVQGLFPTIVPTSSDDGNSFQLWYPIPVMTVAKSLDNYIMQIREADGCKRYSQLYSQYLNTSKINTQDSEGLYKYLSLHSGQPVENFHDINMLYDTIFSVQRDVFGLSVPEWASSVESQMSPLSQIEFFGFADSFEMMRSVTGPMLYHVIRNFNCTLGINSSKTADDEDCKYTKMYGFSGHDTTISPLLYLFQHYNISSPPPYNALLLFELHKNETEHYLRIFYRPKNEEGEEPVELLLKSCGGVLCEFKKFQKIYADYIIDFPTWKKECDDESPVSTRSIWSS